MITTLLRYTLYIVKLTHFRGSRQWFCVCRVVWPSQQLFQKFRHPGKTVARSPSAAPSLLSVLAALLLLAIPYDELESPVSILKRPGPSLVTVAEDRCPCQHCSFFVCSLGSAGCAQGCVYISCGRNGPSEAGPRTWCSCAPPSPGCAVRRAALGRNTQARASPAGGQHTVRARTVDRPLHVLCPHCGTS